MFLLIIDKLAEDDYREIMIIQKRSVHNNTSKEYKVILAWFNGNSDEAYQFSVTTMLDNRQFRNGQYFMIRDGYDALKNAIDEYNEY